jgi:hypothetical protein
MIEDIKQMPLGRIEAPDKRDGKFPLRAALPRRAVSLPSYRYWGKKRALWIDQGMMHCPLADGLHPYCRYQGFCVGCAWVGFLNMSPLQTVPLYSPIDVYHEAQDNDEWPGNDYAGTSVRAGVKVLEARGVIQQYLWATTLDELIEFVLLKGPVVVGSLWKMNMFFPDPKKGYVLDVSGSDEGGHAYVISGANRITRMVRKDGSWGDWGNKGRAWIRFDDLERLLFGEGGEACAATERRVI